MNVTKRKLITLCLIICVIFAMLFSCIGLISATSQKAEAIKASDLSSNYASAYETREMLLKGYEDRTDGKVFDKKVFFNLLGTITSGQVTDQSSLANWDLGQTTMTSADFRGLNGGKDIVVTIDGKQWIATYLSSTTNGPILTFWLADSDITSTWSVGTANNNTAWANECTSSLYGTSYIRSVVLNNGGAYSNTKTTLLTPDQNEDNEFAKFTMTSKKGNLTKFIEVPDNVSWQHNQTAQNKVSWPNTGWNFNCNNDALDAGGSANAPVGNFLSKLGTAKASYYKAWANDRIWLPSVSETGIKGEEGIWKASNSTRATETSSTWLRSAHFNAYGYAYHLTAGGNSQAFLAVGTNTLLVRPAFHLILKSAGVATGLVAEEPKDTTVIYNNELRTVADFRSEEWYDDFIFEDTSIMTVSIPTNAIKKGKYEVTFTVKDKDFEWLSDGTRDKKKITLFVDPKPLEVDFKIDSESSPPATATPTNICDGDENLKDDILKIYYSGTITGTNEKYPSSLTPPTRVGMYTATVVIDTSVVGSENYILEETEDSFNLDPRIISIPEPKAEKGLTYPYTYNGEGWTYIFDYDKNNMTIDYGEGYSEVDFELDKDEKLITGINAGNYKNAIKLTLKNPLDKNTGDGLNVWDVNNDTSDKYVSFVVDKAEIKVDIYVDENDRESGIIYGRLGTTNLPVTISLKDGEETFYQVYGKDTLDVKVFAQGLGNPINLGAFTLKKSDYFIPFTLNISSFKAASQYDLYVEVESDNYSVSLLRDTILELSRTVESPNLIWWLSDGLTEYGEEAQVEQTSVEFKQTVLIYSSIVSYKLEASAPKGFTLQGTPDTYTKEGELITGRIKDAGEYESKVTIVNNTSGATTEYTMTWTIEKAKFNLSEIEWIKEVEYDNGNLVSPSVINLPIGLEVEEYDGTMKSSTTVGQKGSITVSFKIATGYENNYIKPDKNNNDSYLGDFTWTVNWSIVPIEVKLDWKYKQTEDENGTAFEVRVLSDSRLDGKVEYLYYETDITGASTIGDGLSEDEIEVSNKEIKFYKAYPILQDDRNYKFPEGANLYSPVFAVGSEATEITLSLTTTSYVYTGAGVKLKWAMPTGSLNFTYYKSVITPASKLDGAPKDVGTYFVVVTPKNSSTVLNGQTEFEFKITRSIISTQWNENAKPPVLNNLKSIQLKEGVTYEYYDSEMHKIDFSELSKGGTFKIRAVLNDRLNFEFDNGEIETDTVEFTVNAGESLRDPSDISNPNYDFDDEDGEEDENPNPAPTKKKDITLEWDTKKTIPQLTSAQTSTLKPIYTYYDMDGNAVNKDDLEKGENYKVKVTFPSSTTNKYNVKGETEQEFTYKKDINLEWDKDKFPPELKIPPELEGILDKDDIDYEYFDKDGNPIDPEDMVDGEDYTVKVTLPDGFETEYNFVDKNGNVIDMDETLDPYEGREVKEPSKIEKFFQDYWQLIVIAISAILIIIFMSKGIGYANKRKKIRKTIEKKYGSEVYVIAGASLWGMDFATWTALACIMLGVAVLALVFMILEKRMLNKANDDLEDAQAEYAEKKKEEEKEEQRQRDENMRMMFMGMMGGNAGNGGMAQGMPQGGYAYAGQPMFGMEEMRGMITETVSALLPGMQQLLPQQASTNDEVVNKLIEQNEMLMQKLTEQSAEKVIEREVASTDDETIKELIAQNQKLVDDNNERIERLMDKIIQLSSNNYNGETHVVEKVVEKEMPVEKVVEKIVEVPVEVPVEVEKEVVKEVKVHVPAPTKPKKEVAARLTLDEAYALLSKQQQKYFDGLKQYALSKPGCKEKKSTYSITLGQSAINPLLKLTIKKDTTVALFKMEDEYLKDIKRDASGDGTKIKVKETEVVISDAQACKAAKNMIDLREDQIERYADLLKEQRAMKRQ